MPKIEKKKRIKLCILGILRTIDVLYAVGLSSWHMPSNNIVMKAAILIELYEIFLHFYEIFLHFYFLNYRFDNLLYEEYSSTFH